jgi:hypothetical protein
MIKKVIACFIFIVYAATASESACKNEREISKPCYPIADLPNSVGSIVLKELLGEIDFECAIFTHSLSYSLVMICKANEKYM